MYDVIIVGAGCVGCATARELSKYQLKVLVLEKGHDLCSGASKANTGMIHAGYDPTPDTNKAKFNAPGSRMMFEACTELDVPFGKTGLMIFATEESGMAEIDKLVGYAEKNQVRVEVVKPPKLYEMQPNMGKDVKEVLWVPDGGYTNPFSVTFAFAENAHKNGVEFKVDSQVTEILPIDGDGKNGYTVIAREGATENQKEEVTYQARMVVNAAGLHSDTINNMVSEHKFKIIPRFGAHVILDRKQSYKLTTSLMETPHDLPGGGHTKGQAIIPSTGGTMLLGCDAKEVMDPDTTEWERPSAMQIINYFKNIWHTLPLGADGSEFPMDEIIAVFGGCRPHPDGDDFVIGEPDDAPNFVNAGGTESPAFTASPAIAEYVAGLCIDRLQPAKNENFDPYRKRKGVFREMTDEEKAKAIAEDPDYAKIVCRCEMVTEAEIRDAIRRPLGARDLAGVKLRTRAGMGRCQGGFCSSRVLEILAEELGIDPLEVTQCGGASRILASRCGMMEEEVQS